MIHDLHIWSLTTDFSSFSCHLVVTEKDHDAIPRNVPLHVSNSCSVHNPIFKKYISNKSKIKEEFNAESSSTSGSCEY